jgi:NAD(P)H dehydrogenase (quinone)
MHCLLVTAHPLPSSLCHSLANTALGALKAAGHEVTLEDLYAQAFPPALSTAERAGYYETIYDASAVQAQAQRLSDAEGLVLCFPTWWFGFPAILKGWFDRVWVPGVAYDHASDLGAIKPRLPKLKHVLVITSLGSPWWVDTFVMRQPVKRILKTAILGTCAPQAQFEMLSIYSSEKLAPEKVAVFQKKISNRLEKW